MPEEIIHIVGTSFSDATNVLKQKLPDWPEITGSIQIDFRLIPEPENQFDPNAIRVEGSLLNQNDWFKVGYLPKNLNRRLIVKELVAPKFKGIVTIYQDLPNWRFEFTAK